MKNKLNKMTFIRKKIVWVLLLFLLAPLSIYFIASCGNDSQSNTSPPITPPDKPNPPSSAVITKDQITFENAHKSPPSLYIDKTNDQLLLDNPLLIKTTYDKTNFTNITTSKLAFDDATGHLVFDLKYESKGVVVSSSFTYTNFQPILKERKVSVQYLKDDFINSKLNAYDYGNKTYNTPEQVDTFFKTLNDNNKGSLYVNYDLLSSSYELNPQNYSIREIVTKIPKYNPTITNLNLDLTYLIDIITFSKTEIGSIIPTIVQPSTVSDLTLSISFPSPAQYVLNNLIENDVAQDISWIKEKYPTYYYASYAQPALGIGSNPNLGFISEKYLINEVIKNNGLFNYITELMIDGKKESFSIACGNITNANDLSGELSLSIYITPLNTDLNNPESSHRSFDLTGFKKLATVDDLFLQNNATDKIDKFSIATTNGTNTSDEIGKLIKPHDAALKKLIDESGANKVVILPDELNTINNVLVPSINAKTFIYFGNDTKPLVKKVPTDIQGGEAFYTYTPFYTDIVSKDFTKLVYDKTTSKYIAYFSMTAGISFINTYDYEFSFELNV